MDWIINNKPELGVVIVIITMWTTMTITVTNLGHRADKVETRVETLEYNMNRRFDEADKRFDKIEMRLDKMEAEIVDIKLYLKKIDTYLSTTSPNYK